MRGRQLEGRKVVVPEVIFALRFLDDPHNLPEARLALGAPCVARACDRQRGQTEIADRLGRLTAATAMDLAELRRRGVLLCHGASFDDEIRPPGARPTMCWYLDESPRPRPYSRKRCALLPRMLEAGQ